MVGFLILQGFLGIVVLAVFAAVLFGFVGAIRDRKPGTAFGAIVVMLATAGIAWGILTVASGHNEIVPTQVDRARAVNCTADILRARDARSRINGDEVYRFHVRVDTAGKAPYETDSTAAVSSLVAGGVGAGRTEYACRTDRDHPEKVEILWDHPMPSQPEGTGSGLHTRGRAIGAAGGTGAPATRSQGGRLLTETVSD